MFNGPLFDRRCAKDRRTHSPSVNGQARKTKAGRAGVGKPLAPPLLRAVTWTIRSPLAMSASGRLREGLAGLDDVAELPGTSTCCDPNTVPQTAEISDTSRHSRLERQRTLAALGAKSLFYLAPRLGLEPGTYGLTASWLQRRRPVDRRLYHLII